MMSDFFTAWHFLCKHPHFRFQGPGWDDIENIHKKGFTLALDIDVVKVDPKTRRIEDDTSKNTQTNIWLECGSWGDPRSDDFKDQWEFQKPDEELQKIYPHGIASHDWELDCGGATFEEAIIKLANLVLEKYGKK
jgi:hypothetical protein